MILVRKRGVRVKEYSENKLSEQVLLDIINNLQESVFVTDGAGRVILVNPVATELLGVTQEDLLGYRVEDLIQRGYWSNSAVLKTLSTRTTAISTINCSNGTQNVSTSTPVFNEDGEIALVVTNSSGEKSLVHLYEILEREKRGSEMYQRELEHLKHQKETKLIAESPTIKGTLKEALSAAQTDSTVIITGESGVGKDVIANYIHAQSRRSKHPFIDINCAAIPESLFEAELFGYEKGAFTGASAGGKAGLLEVAREGTLFLDEIGDLSLPLQSKLLRALENRAFRRVGGTESVRVTARIICATNRNLQEQIRLGAFRSDLYYRLNEFTLNLQPLRMRIEDIRPLAEHFLKEYNDKYGTQKTLSPFFLEAMETYPWPGNIRELRNVISRAYIVAEAGELQPDPILSGRVSESVPQGQRRAAAASGEGPLKTLKAFREETETRYIREVLAACGGNKLKAAELLDIHRSHLYRLLG